MMKKYNIYNFFCQIMRPQKSVCINTHVPFFRVFIPQYFVQFSASIVGGYAPQTFLLKHIIQAGKYHAKFMQ